MRTPPIRRRFVAALLAMLPVIVGVSPVAAVPAHPSSDGAAARLTTEVCSSGARSLSQLGDRVYPDQGNGGYTSVHTDLHIDYDTFTNLFLAGTHADLTIHTTQCLSDFSFDFERAAISGSATGPNMTVGSVLIDGVPATFDFRQPTYPGNPNGPDDPDPAAHAISNVSPVSATNPNPPACSPQVSNNTQNGTQCPANKLVITPTTPIASGQTVTVTIAYTGRPGLHTDGDGSTEGWFRVSTAGQEGSFVTTEPVGSQAWMPLNNHPTAKPTYDIYDTVPVGKTAIGPGELVGTTPPTGSTFAAVSPTSVNDPDANFPAGSWTWHWHSPEPIASYLVENSIGSYELTARTSTISGIQYFQAQASSITVARKAINKIAMDNQEDLTIFQTMFNGAFPLTTNGVVVGTPAASFEEEMQGKITFAGGTIGGGAGTALGTFAHENMHQWFGDNVSEGAFRLTFWKEGWATIGEYLLTARNAAIAAGGLGTAAGNAAFDNSLIARFNGTGNYGTTSNTFWNNAPSNPTVGNLFTTASTYTRPGTAYLALRQILDASASRPASDRWIKAMKQIQSDFGGGSITEAQLEDVFHQWLPNQSAACHTKLNDFFTQWFDTPYPGPNTPANKPQITGPGINGPDHFYNDASSCTRAAQTITLDPVADVTYGDADFTVSATSDSGLPVTLTATGDCTVTGHTVHVTAVGECTINADQAGDNVFMPAPQATVTFAINAAGTTTNVSLDAIAPNPTPQFSDTATVSATVTPDATATGDGSFSGTVSFSFNGIDLGSAPVSDSTPTATADVTLDDVAIPDGADDYDLVATFTPDAGGNYAGSTTDPTLGTVRKEGQDASAAADGSATLASTGDQFVIVGNAPNLLAKLSQSLAPEAGDSEYVDYSKSDVYVAFDIFLGANPTPTWTSPNVKVANRSDWATTGNGFAQATGPANLAQGDYHVAARLVSNGYILADADSAPLTVAAPGAPSITGSGTVAPDSTSNSGTRAGQFAFSIQNDKKGLKGDASYLFRMRMNTATSTATAIVTCTTLSTTCKDVDITILSTKLNALKTTTTNPMTAFATGQAKVDFVSSGIHLTQFEFTGGTFRLDIVDTGTKTDTLGLTAYRTDGTVFHVAHIGPIAQTGTGAATNQVVLGTGNVVVHP